MRASRLGWLWVVLVGAATGCSNVCEDLASRICGCERNSSSVSACNSKVNADTFGDNPTKKQLDACQAALDTCSCDALACGDFEACGLANDPGYDFDPGSCVP
jgi:hypothetical protein